MHLHDLVGIVVGALSEQGAHGRLPLASHPAEAASDPFVRTYQNLPPVSRRAASSLPSLPAPTMW
jgi:hypothetical protein